MCIETQSIFACFRRDKVEERSVVDRTMIASENSHEHAGDGLVDAILFEKKLRYDFFIFSRSSALLLIRLFFRVLTLKCTCTDIIYFLKRTYFFRFNPIFCFLTTSKDIFSLRGYKKKCHYFQLN